MSDRRVPFDAASYRAMIEVTAGRRTADDDFIGALAAAWAEVCAGLGLHQDLFAREGSIDTAIEDSSVTEIVRLIGYEPRPAVAASTRLAFNVRDRGGHRILRSGLPVRSVPANGERPATFETSAPLLARPEWNAAPAIDTTHEPPLVISAATPYISVAPGVVTPRRGDHLLLVADGTTGPELDIRRISSVERFGRGASLRLYLDRSRRPPGDWTMRDPEVYLMSVATAPYGAAAVQWHDADDDVREPVGTRHGWVAGSSLGFGWAPLTKGLPPVDVLCLASTDDGRFFAGTRKHGVYRLDRSATSWVPHGDLAKATITALATGDSGQVFAGTDDERVLLWTAETERWEPLGDRVQRSRHGRRRAPGRHPWPRGPVRTLLWSRAFGREVIFAGTDRGVYRWINERKGWRGRSPGLPDWDLDTAHSRIDALVFDPQRLELFAATGKGVYRSWTLGVGWRHRNRHLPGGRKHPPAIADLIAIDDRSASRPRLIALTEATACTSGDGGRTWETLPDIPAEHGRARCLGTAGILGWYVGTERGVVEWDATARSWRSRSPITSPDPNLVNDPMCDITALQGDLSGRLLAASPRGDFREREWPHFWIDLPILDVPPRKQGFDVPAVVALRHGIDVAAFRLRKCESVVRADFGLRRGSVARLALATPKIDPNRFPIRTTDVFVAGPRVALVAEPSDLVEPVRGTRIAVTGSGDPPPSGRWLWTHGVPARVRILQLGGLHRQVGTAWVPEGLGWRDVSSLAVAGDGALVAVIGGRELWARERDSDAWRTLVGPTCDGIAAVTFDPAGLVVASRDGHAWRCGGADGGWQPLGRTVPSGLDDLAITSDGAWWAIVEGRLALQSSAAAAWSPIATGNAGPVAIAAAPDGRILGVDARMRVSAWSAFDPSAQKPQPIDLPGGVLRSFAVGDDGVWWIASDPVAGFGNGDTGVGHPTLVGERLFTCDGAVTLGLPTGKISPELRELLAAAGLSDGGLVVGDVEAGAVTIVDPVRRERVLVEPAPAGAVVRRLPRDLEVAGPRVDEGGFARLPVRSDNAIDEIVVPSAALAWVRAHPDDQPLDELIAVRSSRPERGAWIIDLAEPLAYGYDPATFTVNANVVEAVAGETVSDGVLGNGDESIAGQTFELTHGDVVHVAGDDGPEPVIAIDVVDRIGGSAAPAFLDGGGRGVAERHRWRRVPSLATAGPDDDVFEIIVVDATHALVRFGDGVHGARLPSAHGNVLATYRHGATGAGTVRPGQLTLLPSRPAGVRSVVNPIGASGDAPAETADGIRVDAPRSTRRPGRIVSVRDHEWFAASFPGIEHAVARRLPTPDGPVIHIAIARHDAEPIADAAPLISDLREAIDRSRSTDARVEIQPARWQWAQVSLLVDIASDRRIDEIVGLVGDEICERFGTHRAGFGRSIRVSDLLRSAQRVPGVLGVTIEEFGETGAGRRTSVVEAAAARWDAASARFETATIPAVRVEDLAVRGRRAP